MNTWHLNIDSGLPFWLDYLPLLARLNGAGFPDARALNKLLPDNLINDKGHPVRFTPSDTLGAVEYERQTYNTGQVSTRKSNWHDLFNALVWARLPAIKLAMNSLHFRELNRATEGKRGRLRDALTLFDECGLIVLSSNPGRLDALSRLDWPRALQDESSIWHGDSLVFMAGHAMLEKCLEPYKSMTANALLVRASDSFLSRTREAIIQDLDTTLAQGMLAGGILTKPADLSPLPLMGIPGWWPHGPQDSVFYADRQVFRPPGENYAPAAIYQID